MNKVKSIEKMTNNRFLNMYKFNGVTRLGKPIEYFVASRAMDESELKINKRVEATDAVIIASLVKETNKMVLIKQYRYSIDTYIYELPAGLIDKGESVVEAGKREMLEETGLSLEVLSDEIKPFYTSVGLCDECCTTIYGYASGEVSLEGLEDSEDIEVILADETEMRRILKEEKVAQPAGYFMLSYLNSHGAPFDFNK